MNIHENMMKRPDPVKDLILSNIKGGEEEQPVPNVRCPDCGSALLLMTKDFWGYSCLCLWCGKAFHSPPYPWEQSQ